MEMRMPDLATTESEIKILRWYVEVGKSVERGQPLLEVETDKATMDVESVVTGVVTKHCVREGDSVAAGHLLAEFADAAAAAASETPKPTPVTAPSTSQSAGQTASQTGGQSGGQSGGMFARNRAAQPAASAAVSASATQTIALSPAQRAVARRLLESKQNIPHFYLQRSVNAQAMIARRQAAKPVSPAWDAMFVHAVAKAAVKFERMMYRFENEQLVTQGTDAVGVAVDDKGELFVVTIASPATKTPERISQELMDIVNRLRAGDPEARRITPGWITVTNLGMTGTESFVPIINPPQASILGIGQVRPQAVVTEDGRIEVERRAMLTLAVDHRVVSGKYAADFLAAVINELESL
ncbi:MAG: 2-oxo acid dehydrogenase subunit E2 [Phycisphaeraceae bacterium]|nr:2-oxo acid dehydrogenase subunit E2 [Phycisphaeraceae bacterium]